jgi:glucan endo-1,3-alpha-glucosidase
VVFLTSPAHVMLLWVFESNDVAVCGRIESATGLVAACSVEARIVRSGVVVLRFAPSGFEFRMDPPLYKFNAFVAASP